MSVNRCLIGMRIMRGPWPQKVREPLPQSTEIQYETQLMYGVDGPRPSTQPLWAVWLNLKVHWQKPCHIHCLYTVCQWNNEKVYQTVR